MPAWRDNAPVMLDFGGAWVTAGGRDPTSADLTVALEGVVVDSIEFAMSRHLDYEGVYNLVFAAEYWYRASGTENPTVSFAAGAFVSPTHGPLDAFSERVTMVDCTLPFVSRAMVMRTSSYKCGAGAITCPTDGIWRATFVLDIEFSEPVFGIDGGPLTDASVDIYTAGGTATVVGTYVVQDVDGVGRRRLDVAVAVGVTRLSVAVELSSGATGTEVVKLRTWEDAVRDRANSSGAWPVSHRDEVTALGNVLQPFSHLTSGEAGAVGPRIGVAIPLGAWAVVLLVGVLICYHHRKLRLRLLKVSAAPRSLFSFHGGSSKRHLGVVNTTVGSKRKLQPPMPRGKPASTNALAIAKHYEWLHDKEPQVELTARWIDTLADAAVEALRDVQPACALAPGVLKTAHAVHTILRGARTSDDLEALQSLGHVLRDGPPTPLPESLVMAAASLDTSAIAAVGTFGEAEAVGALQQVLASERPLPKAVALTLSDTNFGYAGEADAVLKQLLADLLQQRESYAYALTSVRSLVPACLAAFGAAGGKKPTVTTDVDAFALVREMVEMHARLAGTQRAAEARTRRAVHAPYLAWRVALCGGFSSLDAPGEVAEACRRIHAQIVANNLRLAGFVPFSGRLRASTEALNAAAPVAPLQLPPSVLRLDSRLMNVGGFLQRTQKKTESPQTPALPTRKSSLGSIWVPAPSGQLTVRLSETLPDAHHYKTVLSSFRASARYLSIAPRVAPRTITPPRPAPLRPSGGSVSFDLLPPLDTKRNVALAEGVPPLEASASVEASDV